MGEGDSFKATVLCKGQTMNGGPIFNNAGRRSKNAESRRGAYARRSGKRSEVVCSRADFFGGYDLVDIKKATDGAFDFGHAENVVHMDGPAEIWRGFDILGGYIGNFLDGIHDQAGVFEFATCHGELDHDDAAAVCDLGFRKAELGAEVNNGNDFSAKVDDAFYVGRHLRDHGDVEHGDDFPDF